MVKSLLPIAVDFLTDQPFPNNATTTPNNATPSTRAAAMIIAV